MPSSITSGWSSETSRLITGFSQIESPTPCPSWRAKQSSSLANPNSSALGKTSATSAVVAPGRTLAIAWSR